VEKRQHFKYNKNSKISYMCAFEFNVLWVCHVYMWQNNYTDDTLKPQHFVVWNQSLFFFNFQITHIMNTGLNVSLSGKNARNWYFMNVATSSYSRLQAIKGVNMCEFYFPVVNCENRYFFRDESSTLASIVFLLSSV